MIALSAALLLAPTAQAQMPLAPGEIAHVDGKPIMKTEHDHWVAIWRRSDASPDDADLRVWVAIFLLDERWLEGEAAERGIVVSPASVAARVRRQKRASFPTERAYQRFLRRTGRTPADVRREVRISLLSDRIRAYAVRKAKTPAGQQRRLWRFLDRYNAKWRARTVCAEGYVSEFHCST